MAIALHAMTKAISAIAKLLTKILERHYSISNPHKITNKPQAKLIKSHPVKIKPHHSISEPHGEITKPQVKLIERHHSLIKLQSVVTLLPIFMTLVAMSCPK
jgi:hypothetical protein